MKPEACVDSAEALNALKLRSKITTRTDAAICRQISDICRNLGPLN
jgi:hypothetical protein